MSLVVEGLSKSFGDLEVIKDFDFSIRPGEIVAVVGESGSGKTTFMRIINELEVADAGSVRIDDDRLFYTDGEGKVQYIGGEERNRYRKEMGMVFQDYQLFPNMTVLENLIEAPLAQKLMDRRQAQEVAEKLLTQMNIISKRDDHPKLLSGGQKQRVAICRALMLQPKVLCFDEPTSALDLDTARTVGEILRGIANEGTSIMIITHDQTFASEFSDRIVYSHEFK